MKFTFQRSSQALPRVGCHPSHLLFLPLGMSGSDLSDGFLCPASLLHLANCFLHFKNWQPLALDRTGRCHCFELAGFIHASQTDFRFPENRSFIPSRPAQSLVHTWSRVMGAYFARISYITSFQIDLELHAGLLGSRTSSCQMFPHPMLRQVVLSRGLGLLRVSETQSLFGARAFHLVAM